MTIERKLQSLSDDELLRHLSEILKQSRRVESSLVAYIGEVDERRLYAREGSPSMFQFCLDVLHLSEAEAYLRIKVARASRAHAMLLGMLADGRLHLRGIVELAPHLTEENREVILARAVQKTGQQIKELVAELFPRPDVPSTMRKLPTRQPQTQRSPAPELCLGRVVSASAPVQPAPPIQPRPAVQAAAPVPPAKPAPRRNVEPLAPSRYQVTFTASKELYEKLNRLRALMRTSVPHGDLAAIIEAAVTEKLERLEAKRFGKTKAPRKSLEQSDTHPSTRYIPAPIRRFVCTRDGDQCAFVDAKGKRCPEREGLEFHHRDPYGLGGDHDPDRISLICRAHNIFLAERDYGKEVMDRYRLSSSRIGEPAPVYFADYRNQSLTMRSLTGS